jgi:hypothetical protein
MSTIDWMFAEFCLMVWYTCWSVFKASEEGQEHGRELGNKEGFARGYAAALAKQLELSDTTLPPSETRRALPPGRNPIGHPGW